MNKIVCIYHKADPDGIFSGAIVLKHHPEAVMIGYNYEDEVQHIIEECVDADVYMVDVSFNDWGKMSELWNVCFKFVWIDHHKTAYEQYMKSDLQDFISFHAVFESEQWGACKKVWEYFNQTPAPFAVELVATYDVWRGYGSNDWNERVLPFRHISGQWSTPQEVLQKMYNFDDTKELHDMVVNGFIAEGCIINTFIEKQNQITANSSLAFNCTFISQKGGYYAALAINATNGGDLFKNRDTSMYDFTVGFYYVAKEGWKVSLRGTGKDIDLGEIAKQYGGGGHKNAAGFKVETYKELKQILPFIK